MERQSFPSPKPEQVFVEDEHKYLVAVEDGKIVGYAGFETIVDEGHVINMAVADECRRQGVGRSLMERIIEESKSAKLKRLILEVRISNRAAIALYEKMGFQVIAKRKKYYEDNNEDAFVMAKEL